VYVTLLLIDWMLGKMTGRARRREWERTHTGLNWKDWHKRQ
jgi:hypothetical protein